MTFPATPLDIKVQIALGADPASDPYGWTWTDITSYVYVRNLITIRRGRDDEQSQASPSTLSLTLNNRDGRFTPSNPIGAYYGQISKNTPIQVLVNAGSGYVVRFTGFISELPPRWDPSGNDAYVEVRADGILRRLNQGSSPVRSDLYYSIMTYATAPKAYWPLEETSGRSDSSFSSAITGVASMVAGVATVGTHKAVGTVAGSVDGAVGSGKAVDTSDGGQLTGFVPPATSTTWRVDCNVLFTTPVLSTQTGQILRVHTYSSGGVAANWGVYAKDTAGAELKLDAVGAATSSATKSLIIDDGAWHNISLRVFSNAGNSGYELWVDGVKQLNGTFASEPFGRVSTITVSPSGDCDALGHVVYWDSWADSTDFSDAAFGHVGESAADRINRLCAAEGVLLSALAKTQDFEVDASGFGGTWARDSSTAYSGTWSYRSFAIGASSTTDATLSVPSGAKVLNFWYKVSSEPNDLFTVRVDGVVKLTDSGTVGWTNATVNVSGASAVVFRYAKDAATSSGSDAAWIDDVTFSHSVPMGPQDGGTFLGLLRDIETADIGSIYETVDGYLGYHEKTYFYNSSATMALNYASGHIAPSLQPVDDDQQTVNDSTVQRSNGSQVEVSDADHIAKYGRYSSQVTANVQGDVELLDNAGWRLHLGTNERLRYPQVSINLASNTSLITSWLATDVDGRISISNLPAGLPPDTIELIVNGYNETLGPYTWDVDLNCTPAELWDVATINGTSRVDALGSTLAVAITTTSTSVSVSPDVVSNPNTWVTTVTSPSSFPFDIVIGGERMTAISCTYTFPNFVFFVTRSVNGVVKSHSVGEEVHVFEPAVVAL